MINFSNLLLRLLISTYNPDVFFYLKNIIANPDELVRNSVCVLNLVMTILLDRYQ